MEKNKICNLKGEVTIPKEVFEKLHLQVGEWVEAIAEEGKIILIPKQLTDKPPTKKMNDPRNIWEGRITKPYRFTYQFEGDAYVLRRVYTHDVLKNP